MASILVVEDDPASMILTVFLLKKGGHQVLQAGDAETGLSLARAAQPNLILMDIELPGMDGFSAFKLLRQEELTKRIKVVALTSLAMKGDRERILAAGFDAYIGKPIHYQTFLPELDQILASA